MTRDPRAFGSAKDGSATIEFVVVFLGFVALMTFVIELSIYQFTISSLEKAAEAGARAAAVSQPVATNFAATIPRRNGATYGVSCSSGSDPCGNIQTRTCRGSSGSGCDIARLNRIVNVMNGYDGRIRRQNVTVTYEDVGIGFAGGPTAPMVTVTISGVRFQTGVLQLLIGDDADGLGTLPRRSATMTGEDLAQ